MRRMRLHLSEEYMSEVVSKCLRSTLGAKWLFFVQPLAATASGCVQVTPCLSQLAGKPIATASSRMHSRFTGRRAQRLLHTSSIARSNGLSFNGTQTRT
jgi:hypothetical protein